MLSYRDFLINPQGLAVVIYSRSGVSGTKAYTKLLLLSIMITFFSF